MGDIVLGNDYYDKVDKSLQSAFQDELDKRKKEEKKEPAAKHHSQNENNSGQVVHTDMYINISKSDVEDSPKRQKSFDDSALNQGRTAIGMRKVGKKVLEEHMTPKEHVNYMAGIWDGVETRKYIQNWSSWAWQKEDVEDFKVVEKSELKSLKEEVSNRRKTERRTNSKKVKNDRRSVLGRRKEEKEATKTHRMLVISAIAFIALHAFSIFVFNQIKEGF